MYLLQAEALKERSSSRVKLDIIIRAPLLIIPYTPSPSPSLSPPFSPPPTTLPLPQRAFVANLGELCVKNVFKLASGVVTKTGKDGVGREEMYSSQFLSSTGVPAVVDCMTVTISSVQLGRYMHMYSRCQYIVDSLYCTSFPLSLPECLI